MTALSFKLVITAILVGSLVFTLACNNEEPTSDPRTLKFKNIKGDWQVQSVTLNGGDVTGYETFIINFTSTGTPFTYNYHCENKPALSPWKADGIWEFGSVISSEIVRDKSTIDELQIEYFEVDGLLVVSFSFSGAGYNNRLSSVNGNWIFTFSRP